MNVKYSLLIFCVICAKYNKARQIQATQTFFLQHTGFWKFYFVIFGDLIFPTLKWLLESVVEKHNPFLWQILKVLKMFYYLTKFFHVEILDSIMTTLSIFFPFYTKILFLFLIIIFLSWRFTATEVLKWAILSFVLL